MTSHTFPFVNAKYRTEADQRYAGNPFIEALPALPDDVTLTLALSYLPAFDPEERYLSAPERIQRLDTLQTLVVALPRLVRLARAVIKMICTGYGSRKPFSSEDNKTLQELYELQQSGSFTSLRQTARAAQHSMALIGASGCGKSYGLLKIAGLFPPAIYHRDLGKWQLPCIFIEMSYDGESVHTLASELFAELDRLLPDAGYTRLYMERKGLNAQQRLIKALGIAHEHGAGMIFVDESQSRKSLGNGPTRREQRNASTNAPKSETPLTKLLITASNTTSIPLLMSGTLEMQKLLGSRFSRARRMAGHGSAVWTPLESSGDLAKMGEFEQMLKALWRYQWIRNPVALTPEWVEIFFKHTQGIPDIMVKLFESAQETAIANKSETLTPELVATVFSKEFITTAFGITALRDGDKVLLEAVSDLYQPEPVQAARESSAQFPAPRVSELRAKRPGKFTTGLVQVPSATETAAAANAGTAGVALAVVGAEVAPAPEIARVPTTRPRKPVRLAPSPVAVTIEVASDSDLRQTLSGVPGAPQVQVANLREPFPL